MKYITKYLFAAAAFLAITVSCVKKDLLDGTGVSDAEWASEIVADVAGETLMFSFVAGGEWTASSDADWCKVLTASGGAGECSLRIKVDVNKDTEPRDASVKISVAGYILPEVFTIRQETGVIEQGDGRYKEVNEWIYSYMDEYYLWNENIPNLRLDYSIEYDDFLLSMLEGISEFKDVNHDDGYWATAAKRSYWYTNVKSNAPTKATGAEMYDMGLTYLKPSTVGKHIGIIVMTVAPGSPADLAGIKRGDYITEVDGVAVNDYNYQDLGMKLYQGPATFLPNVVTWSEDGTTPILTPKERVSLSPVSYTDPAVYMAKVIDFIPDHKVGYLVYMGFNLNFDKDLIEAFAKFKSEGITDLVLDLRYNNGGDIMSANLLATLIAGQKCQDRVFTRLAYNASRTEAGEKGEYRIGSGLAPDFPEEYELMQEALQNSLGMEQVYVVTSNTTASASELLINGMQGLDIVVNKIGQTTNGKNVGQEGVHRKFSVYDFYLYPVSCYCENEDGFRDFGDGFVPDLEMDDSRIFPGDFGSLNDQLSYLALDWIYRGHKPQLPSSVSAKVTTLAHSAPAPRHMGGSIVRPVRDSLAE